jgi:hypothetical protein
MTLDPATRPVTVPPMVAVTGFVVQETVTLTLAVTVPLAVPVAAQVCVGLLGCVKTVTAYVPPLAMVVANARVPFAVTVSLSVALSARTSPVPVSPLTVTLIVKGPPVPPPPVPFGIELQPTTNTKIAIKCRKKKGFRAAFINMFSPWLPRH